MDRLGDGERALLMEHYFNKISLANLGARHAPDLNPDEHVWTYLKGMFRRDPVHMDEDFDTAVNRS
ncbi:MAG: hypothetical protein HY716_12920, partial [Planctomycetes bacterium]|nr:hypothetical protein [Planctomycetota bacterium]